MDYGTFMNPPASYGEVAFFWWQGDAVTREKLTWILDQLEGHHVCGLQINYAHGDSGGRIYGLTMPSKPHPLSEEWWELVKWFEGEARRRGMSISLSDYTLSTPGQQSYTDELLREHPEFEGQLLVRVRPGEALNPEYHDFRPLCETPGCTIAAVRVPYSLNPMHPRLGEAVADKFFGEFERRMPGECGMGINFFFSDELDFRVRGLLWSDEFRQEFERLKGYDIVPRLCDLFDDAVDRAVKTRLDYYDVVVRLSEDGYFRPMYEWHQQRGMTFGCDHGGRGRDVTEFGDYFRTMKWNQGPGNDQPFLSSDVIKNKVNSSIAHLYERPRTWLEGFHSSGWQTSSADVADAIFRNFATGQNLLSLHGLYYSTHGSMWEWAPPCNHHHMPYWAEMEPLLACSQRLSWLLTRGKHRCDVAIVYPVAAMEADARRGRRAVDCAFGTGEYLYAHGVDFDFIDFESIERAEIAGDELRVAGERYLTVVVPDMQAVRFGMMEKLAAFARAGGHVVILGDAPTASDRVGAQDELLAALVCEIERTQPRLAGPEELMRALRARHAPDVLLPEGSYFQHRVIDGEDMFMIYGVPEGAELGLRAQGRPVLLDPFSGRRWALRALRCEDGMTYLSMEARFGGLMLVLFDDGQAALEELYSGPYADIRFEGEWQCELAPTLDNRFGDYRLPASEGALGADARRFTVSYPGRADEEAQYSFGTYFHVYEGEADEAALSRLDAPGEGFRPYVCSLREGVPGDAGPQHSYHGLKGHVSDDFIALGKKELLNCGSNSRYVGEGPYYLLTHLRADADCRVRFDVGPVAPERVWLDHEPIGLEPRALSAGLHTLLIKYAHGCRTRFAALREGVADAGAGVPLTTRWFGNAALLPFDALPELEGCECRLSFIAPPGLRALTIDAAVPARVWADGQEFICHGARHEAPAPLERSTRVEIALRDSSGRHGAALLNGPVLCDCGPGTIDAGRPIEEQGLRFYSGGVVYRRHVTLPGADGHVRLRLGDIDCAARVRVNGAEAGVLVAPPYDLDISAHVRPGDNLLEVTVHNTLRNHMRTLPTVYLHERSPGRE